MTHESHLAESMAMEQWGIWGDQELMTNHSERGNTECTCDHVAKVWPPIPIEEVASAWQALELSRLAYQAEATRVAQLLDAAHKGGIVWGRLQRITGHSSRQAISAWIKYQTR